MKTVPIFKSENLDFIKKTVYEDINKIWNDINKPKNFTKKANDYFKIDFFTLPHFKVTIFIKFARLDFMKKIVQLRDMFT